MVQAADSAMALAAPPSPDREANSIRAFASTQTPDGAPLEVVDEGRLRYPDGPPADPDVTEIADVNQAVHRRGAHVQACRDVPHGQEGVATRFYGRWGVGGRGDSRATAGVMAVRHGSHCPTASVRGVSEVLAQVTFHPSRLLLNVNVTARSCQSMRESNIRGDP